MVRFLIEIENIGEVDLKEGEMTFPLHIYST